MKILHSAISRLLWPSSHRSPHPTKVLCYPQGASLGGYLCELSHWVSVITLSSKKIKNFQDLLTLAEQHSQLVSGKLKSSTGMEVQKFLLQNNSISLTPRLWTTSWQSARAVQSNLSLPLLSLHPPSQHSQRGMHSKSLQNQVSELCFSYFSYKQKAAGEGSGRFEYFRGKCWSCSLFTALWEWTFNPLSKVLARRRF